MAASVYYSLNTGAKIPGIVIGTYGSEGINAYNSVLHALKVGYRHVDTSASYGNEEEVGKAIRDSGIPREEIFVTTKFQPTDFHDIRAACDASLKKLDTEYIDLYLMEFPVPIQQDGTSLDGSITFIDGYLQMQKLPQDKVKAIGISNFDTVNLKVLMEDKRVTTVPAVNQVELHPNLAQPRLLEANKKYGILTASYCTIGKGKSLLCPILTVVAKKHDVPIARVCISWALHRGTVALFKSLNPSHISDNLELIKLDEEDLATIKQSEPRVARLVNPWPAANCFHDNIDTK